MSSSAKRHMWWLVLCVLIIALSAGLAYGVERDFGKVDVKTIAFLTSNGQVMTAKLYRHKAAAPDHPLPGVLALHGYQNDKDTAGGGALELARRGFVVLAVDHLGHGSSDGIMNWQTMSGANDAYQYLKSLPFVDKENLGIMGHSMGAMNTVGVGALNPDHKALNPQCGGPGTPDLHNLLLTQAKYEEFRIFRENELQVEPLKNHPNRIQAFGLTEGPVEWNTTYGSFEDGTARRADLINTVHPGITHSSKAIAGMVEWMRLALKGGQFDEYWIPPEKQIYMWKEIFMLIALLTTMLSMIPLTNILLGTKFFAPAAGAIPTKYVASRGNWWLFSIINIIIAGVTYPILTSLGGIGGKIKSLIPFLKMEMGNGLLAWFLGNALIYLVLFLIWYNTSAKKQGVTLEDLGVTFHGQVIGRTLLLGAVLFAWMYLLVSLSQGFFGIEFRFIWPFMRQFTPRRFGYFWIYLIPALAFFLLNGGLFLFGQIRSRELSSPALTQFVWWLKSAFAALLGVIIVWCVQYLPYFAGAGPGFEVMGLPQYGQMWPLMLFVYVPEFLVLLFFATWFFRRTGRVYLGALMIASMAAWFLTAGTVIA